MLSLGGEIARTGGNDDYPPSPNHNFPFIFKKLFPLNNYSPPDHCLHFHVRNILSSCSCHPWLLPVTIEPSISMENSRFQKSRLVFVLLCFLFFVSRLRIFVAADDKFNESNKDDGYDFAVTEEDQIGDNSTISGGAYAAPNGVAMDQERSELCNTDMSSFLPPPYNNISNMVCKPVWNTFLLRYHKKEDNVVTFILSAVYTIGWVAMGFSKDGRMVGSSAMVGWFNRKGQARIKEYYLQGTRPSQVIEDAGELDLTKVPPAVVINGAMIYLAFQAKFEKPLASQPIILAFGTRYPNHYRLSAHDDKTAILFDFTAGSASRAHINPGQMKKNHGVLGTLAWGLFLPSGAIVARYLKHKEPLWYYLHAGIQFLGFLLGLANVVLGQQLYSKIDANVPSHRGIGIFALTLSILQILAFFLRPKKDAKIRKYWNWYHHWFGRIALFFGVFNIVWGIHLGAAGTSWKIGFGFLITMILVTVIILETLTWLRRSEKTTPPETFQMNPI